MAKGLGSDTRLIEMALEWQERYKSKVENDLQKLNEYAEAELEATLEPYRGVRKRARLGNFIGHSVAGLLVPVALPVYLTYKDSKHFIEKLMAAAGLVAQNAHRKHAGKEGGVAVGDEVIAHFAHSIIVQVGFEAAGHSVPVMGAAISASVMGHRRDKLVSKVLEKALEFHSSWIRQHCLPLTSSS